MLTSVGIKAQKTNRDVMAGQVKKITRLSVVISFRRLLKYIAINFNTSLDTHWVKKSLETGGANSIQMALSLEVEHPQP